MSLLKLALAQADAKRERRILLAVPDSPGVDLVFRTATARDVAAAEKAGKRLAGGKDESLVGHYRNLSLLARCCTEIVEDGVTALLESGDVATFSSLEVQAAAKAANAAEAVAAVVGRDGDAAVLALALLTESGFNADGSPIAAEDDSDPT